jgi:hypothetical protein
MRTMVLLAMLLTTSAAIAQGSDPVIRWNCKPDSNLLEFSITEDAALSGETHSAQDLRLVCSLTKTKWSLFTHWLTRDRGPCSADPDLLLSLTRNQKKFIDSVYIHINCWDDPVLTSMAVTQSPRSRSSEVKLCVAPKLGAPPRCQTVRADELQLPLNKSSMRHYSGVE